MKFTVEREPLFGALGKARAIIEPRNTIPILSNARITATSDGKLAIRGSDLDSQVDVIVDADVQIPGATTIPAGLVYDIVKSIPKKAALAFEMDGDQVGVKSGRAKFKLPALPALDYPDLEAGNFSHTFNCPRGMIDDLFGKTQFAISTEETRYYLNGIFFHSMVCEGNKELRACATDGHRLALVARDAPDGSDGFPGVIVPTKTVSSVLSMGAGVDEVRVSLSRTKARFDFGNTVLLSKLIDGTFPDYLRVIPTGNEKRLVVDREQLAGAVTRCATVSTERGRAVKLDMSEDEGLILSVSTSESGSSREEIDAEFEGSPLTIGINARYLSSVVDRFTSDNVIFKLGEPGSPILVSEKDGTVDKCVLMPMRV